MEQLKVLAAALALRDFTVDELSGLSGVNPSTVRSVLNRNAALVRRADRQEAREGTVRGQHSRGRPQGRWIVVDADQIRQLIEEIGTLPTFESDDTGDVDDWREAAVAVAEDALSQVACESDEALQARLFSSARSSLFFGDRGESPSVSLPWWETDESQFAVRARGVDALAALANLSSAHYGGAAAVLSRAQALSRTAAYVAEAMLATPERGEEIYFAPFSQILARSGEFAPLYAFCPQDQGPAFPLAGDWTEVGLSGFDTAAGHILTQAWATPLVNVSACMPIVLSSAQWNPAVDHMIDSMKITPRPALVFGSLHEGGLIMKSGSVGAAFVPVDRPGSDRQPAINSVLAFIDRFSAGR